MRYDGQPMGAAKPKSNTPAPLGAGRGRKPKPGQPPAETATPATEAAQRGAQRSPSEAGSRELIRRFYADVPTEIWEQVLSAHPAVSPAGKLLGLMHDPSFSAVGIERLCGEAGIEFRDLVRLVTDHQLASVILESGQTMQQVVRDMGEDSRTRTSVCDLCYGDCSVSVKSPVGERTIECPKCGGAGRIRRPADTKTREQFLRVVGAMEDDSRPLVAVNQQFNTYGGAHSAAVSQGERLLLEGRKLRRQSTTAATTPIPATPAAG